MSWSQASFWLCVGSLLTILTYNVFRAVMLHRKINKRIGLPAPECQRFPTWTPDMSASTEQELPVWLRRQAD